MCTTPKVPPDLIYACGSFTLVQWNPLTVLIDDGWISSQWFVSGILPDGLAHFPPKFNFGACNCKWAPAIGPKKSVFNTCWCQPQGSMKYDGNQSNGLWRSVLHISYSGHISVKAEEQLTSAVPWAAPCEPLELLTRMTSSWWYHSEALVRK